MAIAGLAIAGLATGVATDDVEEGLPADAFASGKSEGFGAGGDIAVGRGKATGWVVGRGRGPDFGVLCVMPSPAAAPQCES